MTRYRVNGQTFRVREGNPITSIFGLILSLMFQMLLVVVMLEIKIVVAAWEMLKPLLISTLKKYYKKLPYRLTKK